MRIFCGSLHCKDFLCCRFIFISFCSFFWKCLSQILKDPSTSKRKKKGGGRKDYQRFFCSFGGFLWIKRDPSLLVFTLWPGAISKLWQDFRASLGFHVLPSGCLQDPSASASASQLQSNRSADSPGFPGLIPRMDSWLSVKFPEASLRTGW